MGAFSGFEDKRSKRNKEKTPTVSSHYIKLSRKATLIRYICMALVVAFAVYSLAFHPNEITMENFRYMLKFISFNEDASAQAGSFIAFDGNDGNKGAMYKGDLAVLNESGLTVTGWDGEVILRESFSFAYPKIDQNGINLFCYDLGGKEIKIFNSYSLLNEISFDYPIHWFASSESGSFAVASSAKGYRSAVYIYDKQFILVYSSLFGDKYVDFVDISSDGKEFIAASHYSENGNLVTQISKFRVDTENVLAEHKFIGEIPLGIYYTDEGYCLMTSDKMRMFDNSDQIVGEISFSGKELLSGRVFGKKALITYASEGLSGGTEAVVYGLDGNAEYSYRFDNSVSDAVIIDNTLYALSPGQLAISDIATSEETLFSVPTSYSALVKDGEKIILFSENQAEYFSETAFSLKEEQK